MTSRQSVISDPHHERLHEHLLKMYMKNFRNISVSDAHIAQMAHDSLDERRSHQQLFALEAVAGAIKGRRMLEVGSGPGLTVAVARQIFGAEAYGVEPGDDEYEGTLDFSWKLAEAAGLTPAIIKRGTGEAIPFPDAYFDIVYSSNVLEHVNDPPQVITEVIRVLKAGGIAQIVVPNYGSWWEGHYGIPWVPHLPARLGKLYVWALGRDPAFIDTLQLVTRGKLESWIFPHLAEIDVLGWGVDIWEKRVRDLNFSEYSALGRLKRILRVMHKLKAVSPFIALGKIMHWETPLILTFRRR